MTVVGLVSPGEMGASVGAAAKLNATTVLWASEGRSNASHLRAIKADLTDSGTLRNMANRADIILSICPPHDAESLARQISELDFGGLFVDCNAIAPQKSKKLSAFFENGRYVDGAIIGGPAWQEESGTRLYLSGSAADEIVGLFKQSPLLTRIISHDISDASALKMAFAAYTKGSIALLASILTVSESYGVREALAEQWGNNFTQQTHQRLIATAVKGWRFEAEMHEIADTFLQAELPDGFHRAAADIYARMTEFKDNPPQNISQLLEALRSTA